MDTLRNSRVDLNSVRNLDFHGRQIKNAKDAIDPQDYVTLSQLEIKISEIPKATPVKSSISGKIKNFQPNAVLYVNLDGTIGQDADNFFYEVGINRLTLFNTIRLFALTATRPVKTNANQELITGLIDLSSANDRTGILPVPNGGSGAGTFTAGAVLLGNGFGTFQVQVGVGGTLSLTPATASFLTSIGDSPVTINYKDHAGVNQSVTVVQSVSPSGSNAVTSVSITANTFINGVRTV